MEEKDWNYCFRNLVPLLDHQNYLKRAEGAKKLGQYYCNLSGSLRNAPPLVDSLNLIAEKEVVQRGVAGAFVNGLDKSCLGLGCLHADYKNDLEKYKFDPRVWVLDILRHSKGEELYTPNAQSFDFYVHEYFDSNPEAINELIDMGREELALDAATEPDTKVPNMQVVLKRLVKSKNNFVAESAKEYLKRIYK